MLEDGNVFTSLEQAMQYASNHEEKAIITKDHIEYYVINCNELDQYIRFGYDFV